MLPAHREPLASAPPPLREQTLQLAQSMADAGRRLASALEEKERLSRVLDAVLESLDAGVVLTAADGTVLASNRAALALGLLAQQESPRRLIAGLAACPAACGSRSDAAPLRPAGANGPAWIVRRGRLQLPGGEPADLVVVTDVSALLHLQEAQRRRSRLEAAGRMAAELAHEVRNPLGSLELFAAMLREDLRHDPAQQDMAEEILKGIRRLSGVVARLLGAVRGHGAPRRPCGLAALAREVVQFSQPLAAARGITIVLEAPERELVAELDVEALHQALLNLVGNALDASPNGGRVVVSLASHEAGCRLEVHDQGPGVAPEDRERAFEPLFTTKSGGTGLGLAVVERVTVEHGGYAEIDDSPLGGAVVRVVLPWSIDEHEVRELSR